MQIEETVIITGNEATEQLVTKSPELSDKEKREIWESNKTFRSELQVGSKFYGTIITGGKKASAYTRHFTVTSITGVSKNKSVTVRDASNIEYKTNLNSITLGAPLALPTKGETSDATMTTFKALSADKQLKILADCGTKNIWMVGPAGAGKTTMANNLAKSMELPFYLISCGIGTSAAEFIGYKYPQREATEFSKYYSEPSIIVVDEFTALDPAVAQVLNSALANGYIQTTTGQIFRHPECIIIATSNTFGNGANRQYVANNQLDASTIDRFVGGVIEVNYSEEFESQYDEHVIKYVQLLRKVIKNQEIRRVASTRMIQAGTKLRAAKITDWKRMLIVDWSDSEKALIDKVEKDPTAGLTSKMQMN